MKHPIDVHVGQRIRRRRWMLGMTQQQLGTAVGIKFQQIQKYETGMNRVSASRLYDIAQALEVPVAFFFDGVNTNEEGEVMVSSDASEMDMTPANVSQDEEHTDLFAEKETLDLIRCYYRLPDEPRRRLLEFTRALTRSAAA